MHRETIKFVASIVFFWDVTTCILVHMHRNFGGTQNLYLQIGSGDVRSFSIYERHGQT